jgi:hypothetical protein
MAKEMRPLVTDVAIANNAGVRSRSSHVMRIPFRRQLLPDIIPGDRSYGGDTVDVIAPRRIQSSDDHGGIRMEMGEGPNPLPRWIVESATTSADSVPPRPWHPVQLVWNVVTRPFPPVDIKRPRPFDHTDRDRRSAAGEPHRLHRWCSGWTSARARAARAAVAAHGGQRSSTMHQVRLAVVGRVTAWWLRRTVRSPRPAGCDSAAGTRSCRPVRPRSSRSRRAAVLTGGEAEMPDPAALHEVPVGVLGLAGGGAVEEVATHVADTGRLPLVACASRVRVWRTASSVRYWVTASPTTGQSMWNPVSVRASARSSVSKSTGISRTCSGTAPRATRTRARFVSMLADRSTSNTRAGPARRQPRVSIPAPSTTTWPTPAATAALTWSSA